MIIYCVIGLFESSTNVTLDLRSFSLNLEHVTFQIQFLQKNNFSFLSSFIFLVFLNFFLLVLRLSSLLSSTGKNLRQFGLISFASVSFRSFFNSFAVVVLQRDNIFELLDWLVEFLELVCCLSLEYFQCLLVFGSANFVFVNYY